MVKTLRMAKVYKHKWVEYFKSGKQRKIDNNFKTNKVISRRML